MSDYLADWQARLGADDANGVRGRALVALTYVSARENGAPEVEAFERAEQAAAHLAEWERDERTALRANWLAEVYVDARGAGSSIDDALAKVDSLSQARPWSPRVQPTVRPELRIVCAGRPAGGRRKRSTVHAPVQIDLLIDASELPMLGRSEASAELARRVLGPERSADTAALALAGMLHRVINASGSAAIDSGDGLIRYRCSACQMNAAVLDWKIRHWAWVQMHGGVTESTLHRLALDTL